MEILIIGGTGVLSSAVTIEAVKRGIKVTMINRGRHKALLPADVELIKSDKNDLSRIRALLGDKRFDAVIDFLCVTDMEIERSYKFYSQYTPQFFFISSCAVYNTSTGEVCKEDSPKVLPIWPYSVNKWASEQRLKKISEKQDAWYTIIRPCITYGDTRIPYGVYPKYGYHWTFIARILNGKPIIRWNGGANRCNMMRVEDFAVGLVGLIGNPMAYNEAFNICGDETPSFNDVLNILSKLVNKEIVTVDVSSEFYAGEVPDRAGEILGGRSIDAIVSNDKIKSLVPEFRQTIFIEDGIKKTYEAYKNNNYQNGIDWRFDGECDRVIMKWCKKQHLKKNTYKIGFIDYLQNANKMNRLEYIMEYRKDEIHIRIFRFLIKCYKKMYRLPQKIRNYGHKASLLKLCQGGVE